VRVTTERFLGEDECSITGDLEHTTTSLEQLDGRLGVGLTDLGRQTGGPWFIVSDDAVPDADVHGCGVQEARQR
jgi:hypothetical protein